MDQQEERKLAELRRDWPQFKIRRARNGDQESRMCLATLREGPRPGEVGPTLIGNDPWQLEDELTSFQVAQKADAS